PAAPAPLPPTRAAGGAPLPTRPPAAAPAGSVQPAPVQPVSPAGPQPVSPAPGPVSDRGVRPAPVAHPAPPPPPLIARPRRPRAGAPIGPRPPAGGRPGRPGPSVRPPMGPPTRPRRKRSRLVVMILVPLLFVLVATGGVAYFLWRNHHGATGAQNTPAASYRPQLYDCFPASWATPIDADGTTVFAAGTSVASVPCSTTHS